MVNDGTATKTTPLVTRRELVSPTSDPVENDWVSQQLARLETSLERTNERINKHQEEPWHRSYGPMNRDIVKRIDRMENAFLSVGRWMIGILLTILGALAAILIVAWKILEGKT